MRISDWSSDVCSSDLQCVFLAARKQIDQPAAHGELARIGNRLDTDIAVRLQPLGEPVAPDPLARRELGDELADTTRRQRAPDNGGRETGGAAYWERVSQ